MEMIEELLERLQLMEEEDTTIDISDEELEGVQHKGDLCLIEKIYIELMVERTTIEAAMSKRY